MSGSSKNPEMPEGNTSDTTNSAPSDAGNLGNSDTNKDTPKTYSEDEFNALANKIRKQEKDARLNQVAAERAKKLELEEKISDLEKTLAALKSKSSNQAPPKENLEDPKQEPKSMPDQKADDKNKNTDTQPSDPDSSTTSEDDMVKRVEKMFEAEVTKLKKELTEQARTHTEELSLVIRTAEEKIALKEIEAYKEKKIRETGLHEELVDLISGSTAEEVDASVSKLLEKQEKLSGKSSPPSFNFLNPVKPTSAIRGLDGSRISASDREAMVKLSPEEFAKKKEQMIKQFLGTHTK